jgi:hypothetical protein
MNIKSRLLIGEVTEYCNVVDWLAKYKSLTSNTVYSTSKKNEANIGAWLNLPLPATQAAKYTGHQVGKNLFRNVLTCRCASQLTASTTTKKGEQMPGNILMI